jgi:GT2 family glycosyltransferase
MPEPLAYSIVIATCGRPAELAVTLRDVAAQTRRPSRVIVVDATPPPGCREVAAPRADGLPVLYQAAEAASAANQRNAGAGQVETPLVVFLDDDVRLPPDLFEKLCAPFDADPEGRIGGVAGRIEGMSHRPPGRALRAYYRLQAGFDHPTFGGKLFGPAINCLPTYEEEGPLIPSDWLNSTCTCYRTPLFLRERFPDFEGYSFLEDVHLSARIGKTHRLFFHKEARFIHLDAPSRFKRDPLRLARTRVRNQRVVAREILGLQGPVLGGKLLLHKLFVTISLLRRSGGGRAMEILGTWT